jgi:hypothetical protein
VLHEEYGMVLTVGTPPTDTVTVCVLDWHGLTMWNTRLPAASLLLLHADV